MEVIELRQTRQLTVGDTLVSSSGSAYEVTKLSRIGRGIRVVYVTADGRTGRFTAAPEAISRVRTDHGGARRTPASGAAPPRASRRSAPPAPSPSPPRQPS